MGHIVSTKTHDLYQKKGLFGRIFHIEMKKRYDFVIKRIKGKTVLEVGAFDGKLTRILNEMGYEARAVDIEPQHSVVEIGDAMNLKFKDKSFDTVVALDILEHVDDPVKALNEIKRVAKSQIFVCVPNEPYFTLFRFGALKGWCDEHLTALTPRFLYKHLGRPVAQKYFMFKREFIAEWKK